MNQAEILQRIKDTQTADLDPDAVAEIYAHVLSLMKETIAEGDLQRLILLTSVMYKNAIAARAQLQMPTPVLGADEQPKTYLQ